VNASSDDRTNTIVVTGPPETLVVIENVIKELDANPPRKKPSSSTACRNADSLNVEAVINSLFNSQGGSSVGSRTAGAATPQQLSQQQQRQPARQWPRHRAAGLTGGGG
jgi:hypothetical protein